MIGRRVSAPRVHGDLHALPCDPLAVPRGSASINAGCCCALRGGAQANHAPASGCVRAAASSRAGSPSLQPSAQLRWQAAAAQVRHAATWQQLDALYSSAWTAEVAVAALARLARLVVQPPKQRAERAAVRALCGRLCAATAAGQLHGLGPRQLSTLMWAAAKLPSIIADASMPWQAAQLLPGRLEAGAGSAQDVSMALWAAAKLGMQPPPGWLDAMAGALLQRLDSSQPQTLANSAWALASLQHDPGDEWLGAVAGRAAALMPQFSEQGLSSLVWALARLGAGQHCTAGSRLLAEVLQQAAVQLPSMSPQAASMLLWALATMDITPPQPWLAAYHAATAPRLRQWASQDLSLSIWAHARLRVRPPAGWHAAFAAASASRLPSASAQELANMVWGLAKLGLLPSSSWLVAWQAAMQTAMNSYCAPALAMSAYALALMGVRPSAAWMNLLLQETARQMPVFGAQVLRIMLGTWCLLPAVPCA